MPSPSTALISFRKTETVRDQLERSTPGRSPFVEDGICVVVAMIYSAVCTGAKIGKARERKATKNPREQMSAGVAQCAFGYQPVSARLLLPCGWYNNKYTWLIGISSCRYCTGKMD